MKVSGNRSQATDGVGLNFGILPAPPWRKWFGDDDPDCLENLDIMGLRPGNRLGNGRSRRRRLSGTRRTTLAVLWEGRQSNNPAPVPFNKGLACISKGSVGTQPSDPNTVLDEGRHRFSCRLGKPNRRVNQPYPLGGDRPQSVVVFLPVSGAHPLVTGPPQRLSAPMASALIR